MLLVGLSTLVFTLGLDSKLVTTITNRKVVRPGMYLNLAFPITLVLMLVYRFIDTLDSHQILPNYLSFLKLLLPRSLWLISALCWWVKDPLPMERVSWTYVNLALFQKPMGVIILGLGYMYLFILYLLFETLTSSFDYEAKKKGKIPTLNHSLHFLFAVMVLLTGQLLFFGTGHQNALPSVQYEIGFVGLVNVNWILSPFFVSLNTFGGPILASFSVGHLISGKQKLYYQVALGLCLLTTQCFTGWFMRHSQAWRVWGPKFIFTTASFFFSQLGLLAN